MFKELFLSMSSGIVIYEAALDGEDFIIKDCNRSAERIDSFCKEEVVGRSVLEVFPGVKEFGLFIVLQRVWRTGKPEHHPFSLYKDNRISGWRENYIFKLQSGEVVADYDDITERRQAEKLQDAIYRIAQAADLADSLDTLYPSIHAIIQEVMVADNFYIALYDEANDLLSFPYAADEIDPVPVPQKPGKGLTEYVLRTAKPLLCDDILFEELNRQGEIELIGVPSPIWLGVPLIIQGKTIGVMTVQDYKNPQAYGESEQRILEFVSSQTAQAIERKRMEQQIQSLSMTDELTGLNNRRGFTFLAEQEQKMAQRFKRRILLFYCDVDNLKRINDTYGHAQGDQVLIDIASTLKEAFRESDIVARVGGDEFVVLAVDASMEIADTFADRINAGLERRNQRGSRFYQLSLSIGTAICTPEFPCTVSELIAKADERMYQQKKAKKGNNLAGYQKPSRT